MSFIKHVKQLNCFCLHPCTDGNGLARQLSRKDLYDYPHVVRLYVLDLKSVL